VTGAKEFLNLLEFAMASIVMQTDDIRVLLVGKTGVGKTAIARALCGVDPRPGTVKITNADGTTAEGMQVDDRAVGVTFNSTTYRGANFVVTDTAGFGEDGEGTVANPKALLNLRTLLQNSKTGYHMLLCVSEAGRITSADNAIMKIFSDTLMPDLRPITKFIVTHCDNNEYWVEENFDVLTERAEGRFGEAPVCLGVSFPYIKDPEKARNPADAREDEARYKVKRQRQAQLLRDFVMAHAAYPIIPVLASADNLGLGRIWRLLIYQLGLSDLQDAFYEALRAIGWKSEEISQLVKEEMSRTAQTVIQSVFNFGTNIVEVALLLTPFVGLFMRNL